MRIDFKDKIEQIISFIDIYKFIKILTCSFICLFLVSSCINNVSMTNSIELISPGPISPKIIIETNNIDIAMIDMASVNPELRNDNYILQNIKNSITNRDGFISNENI